MEKKNSNSYNGIGTGYVSIMMIFTMLCLTVLSVLSLKASSSGYEMNRMSAEFTADYYSADTKAKEILSTIDEIAYNSHKAGFFEEEFIESDFPDGVKINSSKDGFVAEYYVPINEKTSLFVSVLFYNSEKNGERFEILKWNTTSDNNEYPEQTLNVWDGEF